MSFFDAVFFDMDGLMVDSEPEWLQSEIDVTAPFGYTWLEEDQIAWWSVYKVAITDGIAEHQNVINTNMKKWVLCK